MSFRASLACPVCRQLGQGALGKQSATATVDRVESLRHIHSQPLSAGTGPSQSHVRRQQHLQMDSAAAVAAAIRVAIDSYLGEGRAGDGTGRGKVNMNLTIEMDNATHATLTHSFPQ